MSANNDIQALELLISQWKAQAATGGDGYDGTDYHQGVVETLLNCADDLAALFADRQPNVGDWQDDYAAMEAAWPTPRRATRACCRS